MIRYLLRFNWALLACAVVLVALGVVFVGSAGAARSVAALQNAWRSHAVTAVAGIAIMFAMAAVDYRKVMGWVAAPCFAISLVLLVVVLLAGAKIYGGRRWLWFFQPSEVAKLAVILFMAQVFGRHGDRLCGFKGFLVALAILVPPSLLILAEPDLGTALVLVPTALAMLLAARIWTKGLVAMILAGLLAAGALLGTVKAAEAQVDPDARARIYSYLPLKPHQLARIRTFVNPDADPYGSGWNLRQAKISIGSGSLAGKGIGKGEAKFLGYLPPSVSMNDFIFAVLAEETGFAGSATVLLLFLGMFAAGTFTAIRCADDRGRLLVVGVLTLLFSHTYINVAMSIGLMPITGLPLPFISAGKTFLIVMFAALGMVQSVAVHGRAE
ncbi:MAG: FtsW/RodA/SpoVE family cell cycle protein [Kiritimatiellae bacterium]|nr:FtsW/RodA/SpoVE family cell cycle protein [Kiritimatiellia bacterium]